MANILIAEDDLRILRLIADFLKADNYKVYTVTNGKEALDIFYKEEISLVILDIMMPIYDGWHVCKEIRKKSNIPILILTALSVVSLLGLGAFTTKVNASDQGNYTKVDTTIENIQTCANDNPQRDGRCERLTDEQKS